MVWKLLYSVHDGSEDMNAQLDENIPQSTLTQFITVKATGSTDKYSDSFVQNNDNFYRYSDLFSLYISERVSETDYVRLEAGLVNAWNSVLNGSGAQSAEVLRQEEVITASG